MALSIQFDVDQATRKALEKLNPKSVDAALMAGGKQFQILALRLLPKLTQQRVRSGTGTLARSWRAEQPKPAEILITNVAASSGPRRTPYATFLEFGTRAHKVRPRFKTVLRWRPGRGPISSFQSTSAGQPSAFAFSKGHNVKGIKARNIFGGFWPGGARKLSQFIGEALGRVLGIS